MKLVLLNLDSDETPARVILQETFSDSVIEIISRQQIESAGTMEGLKAVRSLKPDVFAVSVKNLDWQRGQTFLSVFGGLSGAKELLFIDAQGRLRQEHRLKVLLRAPLRVLSEVWTSGWAILESRRQLLRLEKSLEQIEIATPEISDQHAVEFVFLRATPGPGTQAGGASSHINGFINAVRREGANVGVISNDYIAGLDQNTPFSLVPMESAGVTRSCFDLHNNLVFTSGALEAIEGKQLDFIYQRYSRFTSAGVAARCRFNRPLFLEYNGSEVWVGKYWDDAGMFDLLERFERLNLNAAARVFVVSEVERLNLVRAGIADEKIVVNPNGADVEKFQPGIGGTRIRKQLGIHDNEVVVGFVGTFGPWHGVLELAQAITLLASDVRLRFLLVGTGKLRNDTEELIRKAGLYERVIFTGTVPHEEVPWLLDACEILVAPHIPLADGSEFFGSPTKLFEYMAMGKAIVASRLGQIGDILVHEETGLLVEPGNPTELAAGIARLADDRDMRASLGEKARRLAIEKYTWQHNARRVLDAYASWARSTTNS